VAGGWWLVASVLQLASVMIASSTLLKAPAPSAHHTVERRAAVGQRAFEDRAQFGVVTNSKPRRSGVAADAARHR